MRILGPASVAITRTRTDAGSFSAGSFSVWAYFLDDGGTQLASSWQTVRTEEDQWERAFLDFESPVSGDAPGALVLRRLQDGSVIAMYDVVGVSALAFAPDGETFAYSTGAGRTYTVVAQVPR